ncbi:PaaI family thioesterase [Bacteriovoracaceae bacterium]|nr:PaaI family thioesterase [Bacteriovoracaceae bacterium]
MTKKMNQTELIDLFDKISHFDKHMGLELYEVDSNENKKIEYSLKVETKHLSSPQSCHGGVIAAMMDAVLGIETLACAAKEGNLCSTVEFKLNFIQPAKLGDILKGQAQIDFKGKSLVVTSGTITSQGGLVAKGTGTFNLYPIHKKKLSDFDV